jgi:anaerobic selenocysteine-containing dehydrogenase
MSQTKAASCLLCEAACGILVSHEGDRVTAVRGDPDDPMSRGFVCPKVIGMKELYEDPDRLRAPLVRRGGELREASWEEAERIAADGIRQVRDSFGPDALAVYQGNPTAHNLGLLTIGQVILRNLGTKNLYSASSADQVPQMLAAELVFGNPFLIPVSDLDRTEHLLILGANPLVSNGSLMTAPDMRARLSAIRERGGKVVVVDPRRTETAEIADEHIFLRPGSDPMLLLAMVHVLGVERELPSLPRWLDGVPALIDLARGCPPERAEGETGVPAATIRRLALELGAARRAAVYGRIGICHQEDGTLAAWLVYALNAITGNLDREGGAMFTNPAVPVTKLARVLGLRGHGRFESRVRGYSEVSGELPIAGLAEEIETPGPGQVRALLVSAGNPVLSAPNGKRLEAALPKLDFMVAIDSFVNETTRHADVILPTASPLERSHYDVALNAFAVRNFAKYVPIPLETPAQSNVRHDWDLLLGLGLRVLLGGTKIGGRAAEALIAAGRRVGPEGLLDLLIRIGPHGVRGRGLSLRKLREAPHGLDLGALAPRLPAALETSDRRVHLAPPNLLREAHAMLARRAERTKAEPTAGLVLIGRRHLRSNNSWMHNSRMLVKGPARCTLMMHPHDASGLSVQTGEPVRVKSRVGEITVPLEITDEVMPGVVSLPHGFGHHRAGTRMRTAEAHAGVSANDISDEALLDRLTGNAAFSGTPVSVAPIR